MEIGLNMATKKHLNKEGFTLAELLMAVLVISIIMVALAPVITKRVMDNVKYHGCLSTRYYKKSYGQRQS